MTLKRFSIVPPLSSAASIPLPGAVSSATVFSISAFDMAFLRWLETGSDDQAGGKPFDCAASTRSLIFNSSRRRLPFERDGDDTLGARPGGDRDTIPLPRD